MEIYICVVTLRSKTFFKLEMTLIQSSKMMGKSWKIMEINQLRNVGTLFEAFYRAIVLFLYIC